MKGVFAELKRRNVLRAAALYAAAAWLLVQIATQVFPFFDIPNWTVRWVVIAALVGLPFVSVFSWFYELTPEGFKREVASDATNVPARRSSRRTDRLIIAILGLAVVLLLAGQIIEIRDAHTEPGDSAAAQSSSAAPSIAVIPLSVDAATPDQQYFSDGLTEDLITTLSQFEGLRVISRTSSFRFRESKDDMQTIGRALGVSHLLEGNVRREGDEVRISAALVKADDGTTLWSERYDRPYKDLFKLQDEIAGAVAGALQARLFFGSGAVPQSDRPPSGNLDAYQNMLQAKFYRMRGNEEDMRKAIEFYNTAVRFDPRYARAHAGLAFAWTTLAGNFLSGEAAQLAYTAGRDAAATALTLDPNMSAAHVAQGRLLEITDFDRAGAEAEYRRAVQLAPNDAEAHYALAGMFATLGQPKAAIDELQRVIAVDPFRGSAYDRQSRCLIALNRLDEAETASLKAIEMQPTNGYFRVQLTMIEVLRGDAQAALTVAQQAPEGTWRDTATAFARQIGSDRAAADAALQSLIERREGNAAFQIAEVFALRKEPDRVFEWLERARANRDPGITVLLSDPFLRAYANDPRFAAFCAKVSLPLPEALVRK